MGIPGLNLSRDRVTRRVELDLGEWVGHRVLALRGDFYLPGVIKEVTRPEAGTRDVLVALDGEASHVLYSNVLEYRERPTVVSDAVPTTSQVCIGVQSEGSI